MKMHKHRWLLFKGVEINRVVRILVYSDIMFYTGWGFINPILAVYFTDRIKGGNVEIAGIAVGIYFLVKSILQIPVARYIDLEKGEKDDYWIMLLGSAIISIVPFIYIFIDMPWQVYGAQILHGIGAALSFPPWPAIFTRHIDKHEEGLEWSLYYSATDLGTALAGALGGFMALYFGYDAVMLTVGVFSFLGTIILFKMRKSLMKRT